MDNSIRLKKLNDHQILVNNLEKIKLVQQSTKKLLTGPWLTQFSFVVDDLSPGLEALRCVMVLKVDNEVKFYLYSDGVSVNSALNQITCFFKKEILYQGLFCIEFNIKSLIGEY